jgi:hypothetical protein
VNAFGTEFVEKRGVTLDSFLWDDGYVGVVWASRPARVFGSFFAPSPLLFVRRWDDTKSLWKFHKGFPKGFSPVAERGASIVFPFESKSVNGRPSNTAVRPLLR